MVNMEAILKAAAGASEVVEAAEIKGVDDRVHASWRERAEMFMATAVYGTTGSEVPVRSE